MFRKSAGKAVSILLACVLVFSLIGIVPEGKGITAKAEASQIRSAKISWVSYSGISRNEISAVAKGTWQVRPLTHRLRCAESISYSLARCPHRGRRPLLITQKSRLGIVDSGRDLFA